MRCVHTHFKVNTNKYADITVNPSPMEEVTFLNDPMDDDATMHKVKDPRGEKCSHCDQKHTKRDNM